MPNITVYVMTVWRDLPNQTTALESLNLNHIETGIKNATDFINNLSTNGNTYLALSETAFTNALKTKLDGIDNNANHYVLPIATQNALGGVKIDGTTITIDNNGVIHAAEASTALSALTDVNLDDLEDGQILKWDATNEEWVNSSEAEVRTQLSLLEDVDITNPQNGDGLFYNGTTEKWENRPAGGGGGGDVLGYDETLAVLGNPAEAIEIVHRTLLWGNQTITYPATQVTDAQLSDDFKNYDEIEIICGWTSGNILTIRSLTFSAAVLYALDNTPPYTSSSEHIVYDMNAYQTQWIRVYHGSADDIIHFAYEGAVGIYQIFGIKY